jgi:predicted negative regulator of RcsB-dependent stress response
MYKIFMIVGVIVVAAGWIAYAIWDYKMRQEEKKNPPKHSERLEKTQSEISDWAKKMAAFKSPAPPKKFPKNDPKANG